MPFAPFQVVRCALLGCCALLFSTAVRGDELVDLAGRVRVADEAFEAARGRRGEAREKLRELGQRVAELTAEAPPEDRKAAEAEVAAFQPMYDAAVAAFEAAEQQAIAARRDHERALIAAGQLVSFAESVAPILNDRCLACHNARTAKGRLNVESFEALAKGGESGPVVDRETPEFSSLLTMIEDGSMPKDADPLTAEQIAVVGKWLTTGAGLDAGLDASAPLIQIMPKQPHPAPPEGYRVAIPVTALAFSPDGNRLATSGYHEVLLYDAESGELVQRIPNVAERVYDLAFTADGTQLAVAAGTPARIGEVRLFDVVTGEVVRDFTTTTDSVFSLALSPDGTRLATAGADRAIRLYDVATGAEQLAIEDHADWVMDVAWSPDGTLLASAGRDKTAKVFDATTGDSKITFNGHGEPVYAVGFSPDGKQVVTAGADEQMRVWNVADAKEARKIGGFGGEIFRMQVTSEGQIFTAASDKTVRQHGLEGKLIRTFAGHGDWVYAVTRNRAGDRLASAGYDGEVRIWNVADGNSLVTFHAAPGLEANSK